jgi:hypothetical protein
MHFFCQIILPPRLDPSIIPKQTEELGMLPS